MKVISSKCIYDSSKCVYDSSYEQLSAKRLGYLRLKLFYRFLRKEKLYLLFTSALSKQEYEYRDDLKDSSFNMWAIITKLLSCGTIDDDFNEFDQIVNFRDILSDIICNSMSSKFDDLLKEYGLQVGKIEY